jgi:hypothetical protein
MTLHFTRIQVTLLLFLGLTSFKASGQTMEQALSNPVIMQHYTPEQLQEMYAADSNDFKAMVYYFTLSFRVERVDCFDCMPFDSTLFDVSKYEHLRQQDSVYTREFTKYGFKLTLYPVSSLPYEYAIHQVPQIDPGDKPKQTE